MNYLTFQLDWWLTKFSAVTFISTHDTRFLCVEIFTCMGISYYPAFQTMDHTMTMAFFFCLFIMLTMMLKWKWLSFYGLFDAPPSFTPKPCSHEKKYWRSKRRKSRKKKTSLIYCFPRPWMILSCYMLTLFGNSFSRFGTTNERSSRRYTYIR